jgi:rare lipoprotein A (peptidoglycan hydrolase)
MRTTSKTYSILLMLLAISGCLSAATGAIAQAATGGTSGGAAAAGTPASPTLTTGIGASEIATFFGPGLYGRHTACGQTLTPEVVGVANRTLPCGTLVQVTYAGHTLTVPVLDRGPYSHSASWDLTVGAAQALGITETVRIGAHVVGKTANSPALGLPAGTSTATATGGAAAG